MLEQLYAGVTRLAVAAETLEGSAARMSADVEAGGSVSKITAAVDAHAEAWAAREAELQRRLDQALGTLAALQAENVQDAGRVAMRKTLPAATIQLLAKQGVDMDDAMDVATLDAALSGVSVEQRIAVKSQLLRTGALTL